MKSIKLFFVGLLSMLSFEIHAQDPILFEQTWILESLTIDGETFFPPSNSDVENVNLFFEEANSGIPNTIAGCVCDCFSGEVAFEEDNDSLPTFMITEYVETLGGCFGGSDEEIAENTNFQNRYFTFYQSSLADPFEYETTLVEDDGVELVVTSVTGDVAVYSNAPLAIQDIIAPAFSIVPNPVEDVLQITTETSIEAYRMTIFDLHGKQVYTTSEISLTNYEISIDDLKSGLYVLQIESTNGVTMTKKIIKK